MGKELGVKVKLSCRGRVVMGGDEGGYVRGEDVRGGGA